MVSFTVIRSDLHYLLDIKLESTKRVSSFHREDGEEERGDLELPCLTVFYALFIF